MNRQVIPSMFLSVFIVCFFSVLLYDHDRPPSTRGQSQAKVKAEPAPAPPEHPGPSPSTRPAQPVPEAPAPKAAEPAAEPPAVSAPPSRTEPEPAVAVPPPATVEPAPVREPPKTTIPVAAESPHEPPSAFTTTREGESLGDVAVRVYGSAEKADTLWRANRDLLPHRDSPLIAGAVLRTPAE
jgi:hypothetical protein